VLHLQGLPACQNLPAGTDYHFDPESWGRRGGSRCTAAAPAVQSSSTGRFPTPRPRRTRAAAQTAGRCRGTVRLGRRFSRRRNSFMAYEKSVRRKGGSPLPEGVGRRISCWKRRRGGGLRAICRTDTILKIKSYKLAVMLTICSLQTRELSDHRLR
jgi:hypothetical protein